MLIDKILCCSYPDCRETKVIGGATEWHAFSEDTPWVLLKNVNLVVDLQEQFAICPTHIKLLRQSNQRRMEELQRMLKSVESGVD
jgi:hypothetical protein